MRTSKIPGFLDCNSWTVDSNLWISDFFVCFLGDIDRTMVA